jgi:hypothetical protein
LAFFFWSGYIACNPVNFFCGQLSFGVRRLAFMSDSLPTLTDINVYDSLDERSAVEHFLGKDVKQAEALFYDNFLYYQEDLMSMGPRAFCYYVEAALAYLLGPASNGDSDAVNCFCGIVEYQLENNGVAIKAARIRLHGAVCDILENFARYECDPEIYGDLPSRYRSLQLQLT